MQLFNIIDYVYVVDLSLLNYIDYIDVIEDAYQINDKQQFCLNLNTQNKKILAEFIINNINNNIQYGKQNIIVNTCKPMQNWRQQVRGNAFRSYKYKIIDDSIYVDMIKFNQFVDNIYKKIQHINLNKLLKGSSKTENIQISLQNKVKFLDFESIDTLDVITILNKLLNNIGSVNYNTLNYNNIIVIDGNCEYVHSSVCPDEIVETVRLNLLEKEIL